MEETAGSSADGRPSASLIPVLAGYRKALNELYSHFCGVSTSLSLSGWLAFADAFDICPGYLSAEKTEEMFEEAARPPSATGAMARGSAGALSFSDFQDCICLLACSFAEKQWLVEYSAEKAARFRYKLKDAEKGRVEQVAEERLESLLLALELHDASAWRTRAGLPTPSPSSDATADASNEAPSSLERRVRASASSANLDAKLRSLRLALGVEEEGSSEVAGWEDGVTGGVSTAPPSGRRTAPSVPPSVGAGRNSRRNMGKRVPSGGRGVAGIYGAGGSAAGSAAAGSAAGLTPTPPSTGLTPHATSGGSSPRPGSSPAASASSNTPSSHGRSPRRLRVTDQSLAVSTIGGRAPAPPTTPRTEHRPSGGGRSGGGGTASGGPRHSMAASHHAAAPSSHLLSWEASAAACSAPRPSETSGVASASASASCGGAGASGVRGRDATKENRAAAAGGGSGLRPAAHAAAIDQVFDESEMTGGGLNGGGGGHGSGGAAPPRTSSHRLRESTNLSRSSTAAANGAATAGPPLGSVGCPGSSPPAGTQYYALSSRGREPQPLSDLDFVHALLTGGPAGGGAVRKRSGSASRSTSSPREGRDAMGGGVASGAAQGVGAAGKGRHGRGGARNSVQAW